MQSGKSASVAAAGRPVPGCVVGLWLVLDASPPERMYPNHSRATCSSVCGVVCRRATDRTMVYIKYRAKLLFISPRKGFITCRTMCSFMQAYRDSTPTSLNSNHAITGHTESAVITPRAGCSLRAIATNKCSSLRDEGNFATLLSFINRRPRDRHPCAKVRWMASNN